MNSINKYQSLIIGLAVIFGLLIGHNSFLANYANYLIVPFLMIMLFGIFLNISFQDLFKSIKNIQFLMANIIINFIWTPLLAYFLGYLILQNELSIWIGFVMLMVTPCTDWYLVFTKQAKGNLALSAAALPLNLILQVVLLPVYLLLFFGKTGSIVPSGLFASMALILLAPFVLAQISKYILAKIKQSKIENNIMSFFESSQVIFLGLAIMAMFATQGAYLTNNLPILLLMLIPVLLFFIVNFCVARLVARLLKFNYADMVSLNLITLARNSPIALAIAITAFPNEPLIALALVIGPLIELPILALVSQILLKMKNS